MSKNQIARLEAITARFAKNTGEKDPSYQLEGAKTFLRKMAQSSLPLEQIFAELDNSQYQGYKVPCIRLGLIKAPKYHAYWTAGIQVVKDRLSREDVLEHYGPLAHS